MSKRVIRVALLAVVLAAAGAAWGQAGPRRGPMMGPPMMHGGCGMAGGGPGMMGMGCPMMMPGVDLEVKKLENGVSITLTSDDPKIVSRIQKHAEIVRLMHELQEEQP